MFDANLALNQLTQSNNGVSRLRLMTGAKDILKGDNYVSFKIPNANGVNYVKLQLEPSDLYTLEFGKITNKADPKMKALGIKVSVPTYKEQEVISGLFFDQLKTTFESRTGLYLSM